MMGATSEAGTALPFIATEFNPDVLAFMLLRLGFLFSVAHPFRFLCVYCLYFCPLLRICFVSPS